MKYTLLVTLFILSLTACGEEKPWVSNIDSVLEQPGVEVVYGVNAKDERTRTILLPSGVQFNQTEKETGVETVEQDTSENGPVLCIWQIYLYQRASLERCAADTSSALKHSMDANIERIHDFIVANSLKPVEKKALQQQSAAFIAKYAQESRMKKDNALSIPCPRNGKTSKALQHQYTEAVDKLLAVPRPPVMNPCL